MAEDALGYLVPIQDDLVDGHGVSSIWNLIQQREEGIGDCGFSHQGRTTSETVAGTAEDRPLAG